MSVQRGRAFFRFHWAALAGLLLTVAVAALMFAPPRDSSV